MLVRNVSGSEAAFGVSETAGAIAADNMPGASIRQAASSGVRPRILFINRSYWPDSEATGQLLTTLCEGLTDQFEVHVLAGIPNSTRENCWRGTSERHGVRIHRVAHTTFSKRWMALKAVNFLSFVCAAGWQARRIPQPDLIVFETDPFLLPFVARRLQRSTNCSVIGYLQDVYPDVAVALGKVKDAWWIRKLRASLFGVYQKCDRMVVLSRDMQDLLIEGGVASDRVCIIPNWADIHSIHPISEQNEFLQRHDLHGRFVVMYSGNLGLTQRLEEFISAAGLLRSDPEIQFVLVGQGASRAMLEKQAAEMGLNNVLFLDYQPLGELSQSLSAADLHLLPLNAALARCLMPSKLYGILAAGRPYLTNAPRGTELYDITVRNAVGLTVEPGSAEGIASAIRSAKASPELLKGMGRRGRALAESDYDKRHAVTAFQTMLTRVLNHADPC